MNKNKTPWPNPFQITFEEYSSAMTPSFNNWDFDIKLINSDEYQFLKEQQDTGFCPDSTEAEFDQGVDALNICSAHHQFELVKEGIKTSVTAFLLIYVTSFQS